MSSRSSRGSEKKPFGFGVVLATMIAPVPSVADIMKRNLTDSCVISEDALDLWRGDERRAWERGEIIGSLTVKVCGYDGRGRTDGVVLL